MNENDHMAQLLAENARMRDLLRRISLHNPDESFADWRLVIQTIKEYMADWDAAGRAA